MGGRILTDKKIIMEKTNWYKTTEYQDGDTKYTKIEREDDLEILGFENQDGLLKMFTSLRLKKGKNADEIIEKVRGILKEN